MLTAMRTGLPSSVTGKSVSAMTRRSRSARASAPSLWPGDGAPPSARAHSSSPHTGPTRVLGSTTANSSPP